MPKTSRTRPNRYLLLATLVAGGWSLAYAADPPAGTAKDCSKLDDYKAMVDCSAANAVAGDAELARVYDTLLSALGASLQRDLLASSQAAWVAYRGAYCTLVSSTVEGGSFQPTLRNLCHAEITRLRIKELEIQLHCKEGYMGCFGPKPRP
jgi:uncharacterized protein YecT (DUF1311 family)